MAGARVFEHDGETPLVDGETDGMQEFLAIADDACETDWDADCEQPPHEHLKQAA